jgi:hypothetical protein
MDNTSDSRQPRAAPNPVPATEDHVLPRGKLVVEVYVAEQLPPNPPHTARRGKSPRLTSRALTAFAVIGLHASIGIWLWASMNTLQLPHRSPVESLVLLDPIPASASAHPDPPIDIPPPDQLPALPQPALPKFAQGPSEIAVSITASTDVLISNANATEVGAIFAGCSANKTQSMPTFNRATEVTLLVRVEKVGRVSDSKIEVGSGVYRVDEAAQRCLLAHGSLTPRRVNGEPVASWQRVHWPATPTEARLL